MRKITSAGTSLVLLALYLILTFGVESGAAVNEDSNGATRSTSPSDGSEGKSESGKRVTEPDREQARQRQKPEEPLPEGARILVEERPLSGIGATPQQRGGRVFLPVVMIARALGDRIVVNTVARSVEVLRQTGIKADFRAQLNQVRENGAVVLFVSSASDIDFPPGQDDLMLPLEIVAHLLDVSIIIDRQLRVIRISRVQPGARAPDPGVRHASWEFYQADYSYNLGLYSNAYNQNLAYTTSGRIGDGRFNFAANMDGGARRDALSLRRWLLDFERPGGQRFVGGDFASGSDLLFLSSAVRGFLIQQPIRGTRLTSFAGRTVSNQGFLLLSGEEPRAFTDPYRGLRYDTTVVGSYLSFGPSVSNPSRVNSLMYSAGFMGFEGPTTGGGLLTAGLRQSSGRNRFQGDIGFGRFSREYPGASGQTGFASMLDLTDSFNLTERLTVHGRAVHIGANYVNPQSGGTHIPMTLGSAGFNWRAASWLGLSMTTTAADRRDELSQTERSTTGTVSVVPRGPLPTLLFTHTRTQGTLTGNSSYTLLNATREIGRWRIFSNFARIRREAGPRAFDPALFGELAAIPANLSLTAGAGVSINDTNRIHFSQSFGTGGSFGGSFDWTTAALFTRRVSVGAGFSYTYGGQRLALTERLLAAIELPRNQVLQFTYVQTEIGPQLLFQVRGPLFRTKRSEVLRSAPVAEIRSYGAVRGRVYQDINLNGRFDPATDKPLANVRLTINGNLYGVTDESGEYTVENIKAGTHLILLDLLSVRADLTLLDSREQTTHLFSGRDATVDFRLVRTGRIRGFVWLDVNENGLVDDEDRFLSDVRVTTASGRDTLTGTQGEFILGDLPPGDHVVLIDEKTLPPGTKAAGGAIQISVTAGAETRDVNFRVVTRRPDVEIRQFPTSRSRQVPERQ